MTVPLKELLRPNCQYIERHIDVLLLFFIFLVDHDRPESNNTFNKPLYMHFSPTQIELILY